MALKCSSFEKRDVADKDDIIEGLNYNGARSKTVNQTFGNDSIDFDNFPEPQLYSSILQPQTNRQMNSTVELLSMVEDLSKTPDFIEVSRVLFLPFKNSF